MGFLGQCFWSDQHTEPYARCQASRQASGLHYISVSPKQWNQIFNCMVNTYIVSFINILWIIFSYRLTLSVFVFKTCVALSLRYCCSHVYSWKIKENYEKELLMDFSSALVFHVSCLSILQCFINIQEHLYHKLWPLNILY